MRGMRTRRACYLVVAIMLVTGEASAAAAHGYVIEAPSVVLSNTPFEASVLVTEAAGAAKYRATQLLADAEPLAAMEWSGPRARLADLRLHAPGLRKLTLVVDGVAQDTATVRVIPGWFSILPPLLAILAALALRTVIAPLFAGVWLGAALAGGFSADAVFTGLLDAFQVHVLRAVSSPEHAAILLFSCMIGGMVGVISSNGGMQGVVQHIMPWANTARRGQLSVSVLGLCIFFDDYANTLVIGNTVRPVTDRLRISREKLAYLVDSTAAPVACIAVITTWVGYEIGLVASGIETSPAVTETAYSIFLHSIAYSFYPVLAIVFVFLIAASGRDFGPMYEAEHRDRGKVQSPNAAAAPAEAARVPARAVNAALPIGVLVAAVLAGLYVTGDGDTVREIIGSSDAYKALMWASLLAALVAIVITVAQGILSLDKAMQAWSDGVGLMIPSLMILILAWSLADITETLHTADYLLALLGKGLQPAILPGATFVLAAACAFATGTSWGTMGILMPLVVPLVLAVLSRDGVIAASDMHVFYSAVACVLGGAVWGDHCSPISDTTVLSSIASGCDHIEHVRTQLPYALLVGAVALACGTVPAGFGLPWWLGMGGGGALLLILLYLIGRPVDASP